MAPDAGGQMRRIPAASLIDPGWALARFGDGGWWPAVERALAGGEVEAELIAALAEIARPARAAWLCGVPSARYGDVLEALWSRLAAELGVEHLRLLERASRRPAQREMANTVAQVVNVRGAFRVRSPPPPGTGLLLDDRRASGWTLAMAGGQLRRAGAQRIVPLALATLM
jgi:ATP-dependent DNA helicase RecQ